jgi:hypothetical protein
MPGTSVQMSGFESATIALNQTATLTHDFEDMDGFVD